MLVTNAPPVPQSSTELSVRIELLGPPRITYADGPLVLHRRRLRALLYRLAAAPDLIPRDQLTFLFWPDIPEATARRNLVVLLTHLRRALPLADAVVSSADAVGLNRGVVVSDVVLATEGLGGASETGSTPLDHLAAAVKLYRGPFLDGFVLSDCEEFEGWMGREREAWERRYLDALSTLIEEYAAAGEYRGAIVAARRYLATDGLAEAVHRRLIALYAVTGDRAAALHQFERCAAVLDGELGVHPQPETRAVYEAVRDGRALALDHPAAARPRWQASERSVSCASPPPLPAPPNPLIGRTAEVAQACAALLEEEVRLLTLCGPGGSGKTRLALDVAWRLRDRFADGVVFVPLAPVRDPAEVIGAVARACGLRETGPVASAELLGAALRERDVLLVLDNCEHLLGAMPLLADALAAAPRLRVLATSRVRLNLSGEHCLAVLPLPLPDPATLPPLPELAEQPAVALLVARARATDKTFRLAAHNAADLAAICVRLDGLPLALELAAVRLKLLSPRALHERLQHPLAALPAGPRDLPERQQTLRATIDWSHRLLEADAQAMFARLAVFAGGFTLAAAESVCGEGCAGGRPVLDRLEALCDAHLLTRSEGADGELRFSMLESIREYAVERLTASGAAEAAAKAHAFHFAALAEQACAEIRGAHAGRWLRRLDDEHSNLLTAIGWSFEHEDGETGLRLTGALDRFWLTRGHLAEGQRLIERSLALPRSAYPRPAVPPPGDALRARAHEAASALAMSRGDFGAARSHLQAGVTIWRRLDSRRELAAALLSLSYATSLVGDQTLAAELWQEGETRANALSDPELRALLAKGKGREARQAADPAEARRWLETALLYARRHGDPLLLSHRLLDLAPITLAMGDAGVAQSQAEEALALAHDLGHRVASAMALNELGESARYRGDYDEAGDRYAESLRLWREMGNSSDVPRLLHNLAYVALHKDDSDRAASLFHESLEEFRTGRIDRGVAEALAGLAAVATVDGRPIEAARLWGAAETLREAGGGWGLWPPDRREHDHYVSRARTATNGTAFSSAWREGRGQAIDEILVGFAVHPVTVAA
jgi:predicted ATPase/DNA-binding SARP family transcriptional activator